MKPSELNPGCSTSKPPRFAVEVFGERLPLAVRYADLLVSTGIEHGLIGPREAAKIWDRHLINCAVVESLLPHRTRIIDIGSGAGLPGLALAIARPDVSATLVEPLLRRTRWLDEAIRHIPLPQVTVYRARAEQLSTRIQAPVVTARAVARLDQLVSWSWPLLPEGGRLLALKGQNADKEVEETMKAMAIHGVASCTVIDVGADRLDQPVRVVEVIKGPAPAGRGRRAGHHPTSRRAVS